MAETEARRAEMDGAAGAAVDEAEEADDLGLGGYVPRTEMGRLAVAARRECLGSGGRLLTAEEWERVVAERRGGVQLFDFDERWRSRSSTPGY